MAILEHMNYSMSVTRRCKGWLMKSISWRKSCRDTMKNIIQHNTMVGCVIMGQHLITSTILNPIQAYSPPFELLGKLRSLELKGQPLQIIFRCMTFNPNFFSWSHVWNNLLGLIIPCFIKPRSIVRGGE